jgi:plastocyanin
MADMQNPADAFEQRIKDSLEQFEVPYNSSDWAQLERAMDGPRNARWWASPGMIAALIAGTLVVGGTSYLLTQRTAQDGVEPGSSNTLVPTSTTGSVQHAPGVVEPTTAPQPRGGKLEQQTTRPVPGDPKTSTGADQASSSSASTGSNVRNTTGGPNDLNRAPASTTAAMSGAANAQPAAGLSTGGTVPKASSEMTFKSSVGAACPGDEVTFKVENMPEDGIYLWNFGDGSFSNKSNPEHTFTKPGNYQVMLSMSAAGVGTIHNKPSSDIIVIHEAPKASFNAQKQEFEGHIPSIHFENRSNGAKQYHWDFGDGSTSVVAHPDHIYKNKGNYTVKLTVTSDQGCVDVHEREVHIDNDYNLDAPKAFAPSAAETFMPEALRTLGVKFHLMVYTLDGQLVFETSDATKPWTGRLNNRGEVMPVGEFVWVVDVRERLHLDETYTGKVTLKP